MSSTTELELCLCFLSNSNLSFCEEKEAYRLIQRERVETISTELSPPCLLLRLLLASSAWLEPPTVPCSPPHPLESLGSALHNPSPMPPTSPTSRRSMEMTSILGPDNRDLSMAELLTLALQSARRRRALL